MSAIIPNQPAFSSADRDARPACEWIAPAYSAERDYAKTCKALPPGMPDRLELHVVRSLEGVERCTSVIYGAHVYLVHYGFEPNRNG
jgi:hypothetical protein